MRLLFADRLPEQTMAELRARGHECVAEPGLTADDLASAVAGFDALVVRSTQVRGAVLDAADRLALVIRAGSGTNTIDTDAASARGIFVCNVPGRNAAAVAELTMGLLLAIDRRIADNVADVRNGQWDKQRYSSATGLLGSTMGIIGLGAVGLAVAERAAAFGMHLRALAKPGRTAEALARAEALGITMCDSLPELLSACDVVTVHVPSCEDTRRLVDSSFLDQMKDGAILLNTSRGDVVDEQALLKSLDAGRIRAGLDVFSDEPRSGTASWDSPLARHPNVVATHHIGASTEQAQRAIAAGVVEIVDAFAAGEARHCVNLEHVRGRQGVVVSRAAELVRPFPARVVRPDRAARLVTPMVDWSEETSPDLEYVTIDPTAYDDSPAALYVYRQHAEGSSHIGLVCELGIEAFADGNVRGHEAVQERRVEALIRHQATTDAPPALVTLIHRAGPAFVRALEASTGTAPLLDFTGPAGAHQTVWRVPEGQVATAAAEELAAADHYIADGHHRVAAALRTWSQRGRPPQAGVLCVVHAMDGLRLAAFHRRVSGPVDPAYLLELLAPAFDVRPSPRPPTPVPGSFGLYVTGSWSHVTYRGSRDHGLAGLDAAILQTHVLDRLRHGATPGLEITPVRASVDDLVEQCDLDGGALFTLAPPPLEIVTSLADAGVLMPPKTTYFTPKPCSGIFLRR